jgi:uncharacterized membrane protein (DUF2068 family)
VEKKRPLGVTIVAILMVITGIILLGSGIFAVSTSGTASQLGGSLLAVTGTVGIILGIAHFVLAWGLFTAKVWAWIITVILAVISIILSIVAIASGGRANIVSLIISAIILYYMTRTEVKSYFGRGVRVTNDNESLSKIDACQRTHFLWNSFADCSLQIIPVLESKGLRVSNVANKFYNISYNVSFSLQTHRFTPKVCGVMGHHLSQHAFM